MTSKALMKRSEEEMKSGEESSDDSGSEQQEPEPSKKKQKSGKVEGEGGRYEKLERLKREKRLAMNRECARARRRRKKLRLELLEGRVQEMTQKNSKIQEANDALRARVAQLEAELNMAKSTVAMLSGSQGHQGAMSMSSGGGLMDSGRLPGSSADSQAFLNEKFNLQRRAALAGLGGGPGSFGGLGGAGGGLGGTGGGSQDPAAALRYMQLMQAKNSFGNHQFGGPAGPPGFAPGFGAEGMASAGSGAGGADSYSGMY